MRRAGGEAGGGEVAAFLGYGVAAGARAAAGEWLPRGVLPLVLDLDETLLVAWTGKKLGEALSRAARAAEDAKSGAGRCA